MLNTEKTSDVEKKTLKTETTQEEALTEGKFADFGKALAKKAVQPGKNIKKALGDDLEIFDRTMLILDLFERRAKTKEASLQVEIARLKYNLPRLIG
jgi:GTP-binding protein HflX